MTINDELLKKAQAAGAKLTEAERQAQLARTEYHAVVRRMHLAGGSLREIAEALGLSHQRVQQMVNGAGGSWWQRVWRSRNARTGLISNRNDCDIRNWETGILIRDASGECSGLSIDRCDCERREKQNTYDARGTE